MRFKYKNIKPRKFKPARRRQPVILRSKIKQERTFKIGKYIKFLVILGLFVAAGWWTYKAITSFVFDSGYFDVKKIEITGINNITETEILALLPFRVGDNILKIWPSSAEKNLAKSKKELKNIDISRGWQKISIKFEERKPVACVSVNGNRLGIDMNNIPFPLRGKWKEQAQTNLPEITASDAEGRKEILKFIALLLSDSVELYNEISDYSVEPKGNIVFKLKNNTKVFWGTIENGKLKDKIEKLTLVQKDAEKRFNNLEYINLYYFDDGRVLIKPLKS